MEPHRRGSRGSSTIGRTARVRADTRAFAEVRRQKRKKEQKKEKKKENYSLAYLIEQVAHNVWAL